MLFPTGDPRWRTVRIALCTLSVVVSGIAAFVLRDTSQGDGDVARFFGRFHTLIIHLPIGAVVLVVLLEAAALLARDPARFDDALEVALPASAVSAAGAFFLGLLLSRGGGYPASTIAWHRGLTLVAVLLIAASGVVFTLSPRDSQGKGRVAYRAVLATAMAVLSIGAHFGGNLSQGEGYLTRYAPEFVRVWLGETIEETTTVLPLPAGEEPLMYADVVAPVMTRTCVSCHGPKEAKGKLRLDSFEAIQQGGEHGPAVIAGQGAKSPLYARIALPTTDDDHMPPAEHPQPSDAEREVLKFWIDRGASNTLRVADALPPVETRTLLEGAAAARAAPPTVSSAAPEPSAAATEEAPAETTPAPTPPTPASIPRPSANGLVFQDVVLPILRARCESCHGPAKSKGKLRIDSLEAVMKGGKEGPSVIAGNAAASPLVARIHLPMADDHHMPPPKEPQPSATEVQAIEWWINQGASADLKVSAMPASLRGTPTPAPPPPVATAPEATPSASASAPPVSTSPPVAEGPKRPLPAGLKWEKDVVMPILVERCASCHGGKKPEGGLGLEDSEGLHKGGDSGPAVIPGDPDKSPLLQRIALPIDNDEHMPPAMFTQVTPVEAAVLASWIRAGASEGLVDDANLTNAERDAIATLLPAPPAAEGPKGPATGGPPPLVAGGSCAACAVGAVTGGVLPVATGLALVLLAFGRRLSSRTRRGRD